MSFNPFKFIFNKPKTLDITVDAQTGVTTASTAGAPMSRAQDISNKLIDLIAASKYLQAVIVERLKSKAVSIDSAVDPETARALMQTYGVTTPPDAITIPMFNALLDADIGTTQLNMAIGNNFTLEANPYQAKDLLQITQTVEKHLINDGTYSSALATMLRPLKADAAIFQAWDNNLKQYPAMTPSSLSIDSFRPSIIQARNIDLSMGLYNTLDNYSNRFASAYSGVYALLAQANHVEQDINSVVNEYFYQPLESMVRIVGMLNALRGLAHKPALQDMADDLANFAYIRMANDTSNILFSLDQLVQMAVTPLKRTLGSLGNIVSIVQGVGRTTGRLLDGGLKGMIKNNACAKHSQSNRIASKDAKEIPGLSSVASSIRTLAEHLDWGTRAVDRHLASVEKQFLRMNDRRLSVHGDKLDIMCSLGALETLTNLAKGFVSETQAGSSTTAPTPQPAAVSRILSNIQTATSTTFVVQADGDVVVNPPDMPTPSDEVKRVLSNGGISFDKNKAVIADQIA